MHHRHHRRKPEKWTFDIFFLSFFEEKLALRVLTTLGGNSTYYRFRISLSHYFCWGPFEYSLRVAVALLTIDDMKICLSDAW